MSMWVVHVVQVLCLVQVLCRDECGAWGEVNCSNV